MSDRSLSITRLQRLAVGPVRPDPAIVPGYPPDPGPPRPGGRQRLLREPPYGHSCYDLY